MKCIICGKSGKALAVSPDHPEKRICLDCLNGLVFSLNTLEKELRPLYNALDRALDAFNKEIDKKSEK
jgi:hypothetical protein